MVLINFLSAKMASVSTFFQMFIVLGMYNFAVRSKLGLLNIGGANTANNNHHCQKFGKLHKTRVDKSN